MKAFVTGGAGFVGSNLVDRLIDDGHSVVVYDNFSTGKHEFLDRVSYETECRIIKGDLLDTDLLNEKMKGCDIVFHLAANADVRFGLNHPTRDLEQNTIATSNVLEAMRINGIKKIMFSSTGSIYGDTKELPTPENAQFPIQTSLYGASKLACEGLIQAYCEGYDFQAYIFRFVSILGERYTHGHIYDFYHKLMENPNELEVLGDGKQTKSYLYVQDCIDAIFLVIKNETNKVNIFNLGTDEHCEVNDSIGWITKSLKLSPKLNYNGGVQGWVGDNSFIYLDTKKARKLGWKPKLSIEEAVIKTVEYLKEK